MPRRLTGDRQQHCAVALVDLVTTGRFNLLDDLLALPGQADPSLGPESSPVVSRRRLPLGPRG